MTVVGSSVNCVVEGAGAFRPGELDTVYDIYLCTEVSESGLLCRNRYMGSADKAVHA